MSDENDAIEIHPTGELMLGVHIPIAPLAQVLEEQPSTSVVLLFEAWIRYPEEITPSGVQKVLIDRRGNEAARCKQLSSSTGCWGAAATLCSIVIKSAPDSDEW